MTALEIAEITIYSILIFPANYCLFKHGRQGILAWFYLCAFCIIRIVGNALLLHDESSGGTPSTAALIVSSLGVAPLLLASLGVLHEARRARHHTLSGWREWFFYIQYHTLLATGIVLLAIGAVKLYSSADPSDGHPLLDAGLAILDLSWALLLLWTLISVFPRRRPNPAAFAFGDGTKLLYAVLISLLFTGLRVLYATIYYASDSLTIRNSLALKVCLSVVPELLAAVLLVLTGILTRDMSRKREQKKQYTPERDTAEKI